MSGWGKAWRETETERLAKKYDREILKAALPGRYTIVSSVIDEEKPKIRESKEEVVTIEDKCKVYHKKGKIIVKPQSSANH